MEHMQNVRSLSSRSAELESHELTAWLLFLVALFRPLVTFGFLFTAPHTSWQLILWMGSIPVSLLIEYAGGREPAQPPSKANALAFDVVLFSVFTLQLGNFVLLARFMQLTPWWSRDAWAGLLLCALSSGYATVVLAHELIHRQSRVQQWMGRILLSLVFYEHWYTEHLRAHHVNVGRYDDPGSARFGESYVEFCMRSIPGQFKSAWRLEQQRLAGRGNVFRRLLRNRVAHGLALELGLAVGLLTLFGPAALLFTAVQGFMAVLLLEAVDYFAHWGLTRDTPQIDVRHAWDTDSRMTLYAFVGLSRHADHHLNIQRPYYQLRRYDESPKLPYGYPGMVLMVIFANRRFQRVMTEELIRQGLMEGVRLEHTSVRVFARVAAEGESHASR